MATKGIVHGYHGDGAEGLIRSRSAGDGAWDLHGLSKSMALFQRWCWPKNEEKDFFFGLFMPQPFDHSNNGFRPTSGTPIRWNDAGYERVDVFTRIFSSRVHSAKISTANVTVRHWVITIRSSLYFWLDNGRKAVTIS